MAAFSQEFSVFVRDLDALTSRTLAETAHQVQSEIVGDQRGRRGVQPAVTSAVDGVQGRAFEQVKPDGVIVLLFDYRPEIVSALFAELVARSPVGPPEHGQYRDEHFCMIDGRGLPPRTVPTVEQVKNARRLTLTNPMPYARKLEVANHIYQAAMAPVAREFSGVARFNFSYVDLQGAYSTKRGVLRYPCIHIDRGDV